MAANIQQALDHQQEANQLLSAASTQPASIWNERNKSNTRRYLNKQDAAHTKFFSFNEEAYIQHFVFPALNKCKTVAKFFNDAEKYTTQLSHSATDKRKIRALMVSAFIGKKVGVATCYKHDCIDRYKAYIIEFASYYFTYEPILHQRVKLPTTIDELYAAANFIKKYKNWCQRQQRVSSTVNSWFRQEEETDDEPPTWNPVFFDFSQADLTVYKESVTYTMRRFCMCLCLVSQAPNSFPQVPKALTIEALIEDVPKESDSIPAVQPRLRSESAANNSSAPVVPPLAASKKYDPEYVGFIGAQALLKEKQKAEMKQHFDAQMQEMAATKAELAKKLKKANDRIRELETKSNCLQEQLEERTAKLCEKAAELENAKMLNRNLKRRLEAAGEDCSPLFPGNNNHNHNHHNDAPPPRKRHRANDQHEYH